MTTAGAGPAPRTGGPTWREFLTAQANGIIACDFLPIDLVDLHRVHALVFPQHRTRRLHIAGITAHPTAQWTVQQARNPAVDLGVRPESPRFLVRDRDGKYADSCRHSLRVRNHRGLEDRAAIPTDERAL